MRLATSNYVRVHVGFALLVTCLSAPAIGQTAVDADEDSITVEQTQRQAELLGGIRQLTFAGRRAGEGYFSADGKQMVFQSEREADNPFFQIYLMDLENGDTRRISPGVGKTTCAWISPNGEEVIYASTQFDPKAIEKQKAEIEERESGVEKRYSWDYDETYDLVTFNTKTHQYQQLTTEIGYDAEGSYSPDGKLVCFASNRRAYSDDLSEEEKKLFEFDPASAMDIYIMNRDGSGVKRLTEAPGYDGGPFFSPDGKQICWRRFSTNGAQAEIMLMNIDGSNQRAITKLESMSWAPFFHPSGDYLIFATNLHGFNNFELYMIDAEAEHDPVRVTYREGFDGLPVFKPDGQTLVWTSNSGADESQLYEATWNDTKARELLGLADSDSASDAAGIAASVAAQNDAGFKAADVGRHIEYLCRPELGGRMTGSAGEKQATAYVAAYLESLGLQPAGEDGTFFHSFEFVSSVTLGPSNSLSYDDETYKLDRRWRPVFFSKEGKVAPTGVVCAGYGIVAPAEQGQEEYDSYVHLDVKDKWVLVFREMPQDIPAERRQQIARYSGARYKAMVARDRGAAGIIFVSGPTSPIRNRLMPLQMDGSLGATSISVISVDDSVAEAWMERAGKSLADVQKSLDDGSVQMGFELEGVTVAAEIDVEPVKSSGRNVVARLAVADAPTQEAVLVGAHIDHLGNGEGGGSLAKDDERGGMHRGADDNASGVAGMLEMAQYLADQIQSGRLKARRDILFAAWSGEELGLRGSQAFAEDFNALYPATEPHGHAKLHGHAPSHADAAAGHTATGHASAAHAAATDTTNASVSHSKQVLYPRLAAALNLDMIGRLRGDLVLQGIGSSGYWEQAIERRNAVVRLGLTLQDDCYLPTDASTFFLAGVPILSAFTGSHPEYHTPRDVPELINFDGAAKTARLMALITRDLVTSDSAPIYQEQEAELQVRATLRAFLGTVPDYADEAVKGVLLNSVKKGGPADKGGIRGGDVIVELAGKKIENIYDYTYAIEALKVGQEVKIKVMRDGKAVTLDVTPQSRQ
ncbi:MAG: M28 family peptidase [Aureliella sp.]